MCPTQAIVEQLFAVYRGQIAVESTPGKGSTFTVSLELPLVTDPAPPMDATPEAATQGHDAFLGCRVLVADDVAMNRDVVAGMLDSLSISPATRVPIKPRGSRRS